MNAMVRSLSSTPLSARVRGSGVEGTLFTFTLLLVLLLVLVLLLLDALMSWLIMLSVVVGAIGLTAGEQAHEVEDVAMEIAR
jgi:hypothetical protein